jgi:hypothetical protein
VQGKGTQGYGKLAAAMMSEKYPESTDNARTRCCCRKLCRKSPCGSLYFLMLSAAPAVHGGSSTIGIVPLLVW